MSRREFIGAVGGGALAAAALAACGSSTSAGGGQAPSAVGNSASVLPDYVPKKLPTPPQFPARGIASAGYTTVPAPFQGYDGGGVPGSGGTVTMFSPIYGPPIAPEASNPYWKAINKALGVNLQTDMVPDESVLAKQQAIIASGHLPDMMEFTSQLPDFAQLMEHDFVDLTPILSGKGVRKYPNLANLPTYAWKNSLVAGRIFGIPIARPMTNSYAFFYRSDITEKTSTPNPKNATEFMALAKELTNSKKGVWAIGSTNQGAPNGYMYPFFAMMFGVPNDWSVSSSGQFTSWLETPEWLEALSYMQKLYKAGVFYPGSAATDDLKEYITSGKIVMYQDGVTAIQGGAGLLSMMEPHDPSGRLGLMIPPAHDGGKQTYWNGNGLFGLFTAISKGSQAHTEEMLRIMDYCASPSFSKEDILINDGIAGRDYKLVKGSPVATPTAAKEVGWLATYIAEPPFVFSSPGYESAVKIEYDYGLETAKIGTNDPSQTLYSPTNSSQGATLSTNVVGPAIQSVVQGRSTVKSWSTTVQQWRSQGGDKIRKEFEQAYAKEKKK